MDVSSAVWQYKNAKLDQNQEVGECSSRLCTLPDVILIRILSFLSMKEAVRTSILSKRWEYLWTSIPDLSFEQPSDFVDRALHLRDHRCPIKSFSFRFHSIHAGYGASRVSTWLAVAVKCKVQELKLYNCGPFCVVPRCIFTCETLVKLDLQLNLDENIIFRIPPSVWLPNLKVLSLNRVKFPDEVTFQKLLSCPLLEELLITRCNTANLKSPIRIFTPKLRKVEIVEDHEFLGSERYSLECQVSINGSSLQSFEYSGELINGYCIAGTCAKLVKAKIDFNEEYTYDADGSLMDLVVNNGFKLLNSLSTVKNLEIVYDSLRILGCQDYSKELLDSLPVFSNMTRLTVEMKLFRLDCTALLAILRKSPCLQHLAAYEGCGDSSPRKWKVAPLDPVPSCFLTQLKTFDLEAYGFETDEEFQIIGVLLKAAMVLEEMILNCPLYLFSDRVFLNKLQQLPISSKECKIYLVNSFGKFMLDS